MKKSIAYLLVLALAVCLCCACSPAGKEAANPTLAPEETQTEGQQQIDYVNVYLQQLRSYHTALTEGWEEGKYYENGMCPLASYYYEGNPLDNAGFAFADMDGDGDPELIIGAILNADQDPAVFEIWTLVDGVPQMLVQSGYRNRYFAEKSEDGSWLIANEASNSAANSAWHYYSLEADALKVQQAVVFDAMADETNPWFLATDDDWNTGNDTPVAEAEALAIVEGHANAYTSAAYIPFSQLGAME